MMKNLLLFVLTIAISFTSLAQERGPEISKSNIKTSTLKVEKQSIQTYGEEDAPEHRTCATMTVDSMRRAENEALPSLEEFENWLQVKISQESNNLNGVVSLPIVVHVINNGEAVGNGSNISEAQVESQIVVLNEDFRRLNADTVNTPTQYQPVAADAEIEFCLATVDEQGNVLAEAGIDRVNRVNAGFNAPPYSSSYIDNVIKPATIWDPTKYCNIWVLELSGNILGYGQFPSQSGLPGLPGISSANTDGIVVDYNSFGRGNFPQLIAPHNLGRTATHEMGHWLGLRHIWGDGPCSADDYCNDTPLSDAPNYGCQTGTASCGSDDMVENYMDYSNDACFNLFTQDQKTRMRTVLENSPRRAELLNSIVCDPNQPPVADFRGQPLSIFAGGTVSFTDESSGNPTQWQWNFPGSVQGSSNSQNPVITYQVPGTYPVTLIATNANGSDTESKNAYVEVKQPTDCDTLNFPPGNGSLTIFGFQGEPLTGYNSSLNVISNAQYFDNAQTFNYVTGAIFYFLPVHKSAGSNASVTFKMWDATGPNGKPGNVVDSLVRDLSVLEAISDSGFAYQMMFDDPAPINGNFYLGFTMNNFQPGDTMGLITSSQGSGAPGYAWQGFSNALGWQQMDSIWTVNNNPLLIDLFISPLVTKEIPQASFTASKTELCMGENVTLDASATTNGVNYAWLTPGATPPNPVGSEVTVTYDSAGTHPVFLRAFGVCGATDDTLSENLIDVYPNPVVDSFTTDPAACGQTNGSATAHVSGGTEPYTYQWGSGTNNQSGPTATNLGPGSYFLFLTDSAGCTDVNIANIETTGGPDGAVGTVTNVTCPGGADGEATVSATQGTPPYTYDWSNGGSGASQSNLAAGTYTVTITDDKSCEDVISVNVIQPDTFNISAAISKSSCTNDDGEITLTTSGGTPSYSFNWSDGQQGPVATGLSAGNYTVTLTDSEGCTETEEFTVEQYDPVVADASVTSDATCSNNDGVATVSASGGRSPFTYLWSSGGNSSNESGLAQGIYYVTITDDNGCSDVDTVDVGLNDNLTTSITSDQEICDGDSAQITVSGGNTYSWDNGETTATINVAPSQTTTYEVIVLLGVCVDTLESEVTVKPLPNTEIQEGDSITVCEDEQFTLNASGANSFNWSTGETSSSIQLTGTTSQSISVEGTTDGCATNDTIFVTVEQCVGINDLVLEDAVTVYPNPANNLLQLDVEKMVGEKLEVMLFNASGQVVHTEVLRTAGNYSVDISDFAAGIYHLQIGNDKVRTEQKITIIR